MKLKVILTFVLIMTLSCLAAGQMNEVNRDKSTWNWISSDDGRKIEVRVENKVEFNDDYSDVSNIPGDGSLKIFDSRGPRTFRLQITRGAAGELKREYSVDGQRREFDNEGRQWLRTVLLQAVREGGLEARNRAQRILKQRGVRGLADELAYVKGDYVRRIYFEAFLKAPGLTNDDLKSAIRNASQTIDSEYERAQLSLQVAHVFVSKDELAPEFFAALDRLSSDYERRRTLTGILRQEQPIKTALSAMANSARAISSDYEKGLFLMESAERYHADDRLRANWFNVLRTINSDYEHRRVLSKLLKVATLNSNALVDAMESASRMQSDYEKATFLIDALGRYQSEPRLRTALINTAKTISSEYERGRVQKRLDRVDF
ncbi:MAG TPA: hypothetical protein VLA93_13240 [Pyrinomonadaceae bacterium]|nr:hypothetical protein [Pyrinomonadaceae bacterium]